MSENAGDSELSQTVDLSLLLGDELWPEPLVSQITACVEVEEELRILAITERTPKSRIDFIALNACRAWADVVLTSGRNLRLEENLSFDLGQLGEQQSQVEAWQGAAPGTADVAYLTSGRDIPLGHPAIDDQRRSLFMTSLEGARRLEEQLVTEKPRGNVQPVGLERSGPREALDWLQRHGYGRVSIELGPSTARQLHRPSRVVDQLVLSTYCGEPDAELVGEVLLTRSELERSFERVSAIELTQESGWWRFERWVGFR